MIFSAPFYINIARRSTSSFGITHYDGLFSLEEIRLGSTPVQFSTSKPALAGALTISFPVDEGKLVASQPSV